MCIQYISLLIKNFFTVFYSFRTFTDENILIIPVFIYLLILKTCE